MSLRKHKNISFQLISYKMYTKHPFLRSYDEKNDTLHPIFVSKNGFVKIYVAKINAYMSTVGYLSKRNKYYRITVPYKNKKKKSFYVHRLVAETFCHKPAKELKIVHHLNHNEKDNRAENLEWTSVGLNALMKKNSLCYEETTIDGQTYYQPRFHWQGQKCLAARVFKSNKKARHYGLKFRQKFYDEERNRIIEEQKEETRKTFDWIFI